MKILSLPINQTSFGFVSFNILNELYNRGYDDFLIQDIGQPNLSSFDKRRSDEKFLNWLNDRRANFFGRYKKNDSYFKLWHINGADSTIGKNKNLYTFNESDGLTSVESNIINNSYDSVTVSCEYSKQVFEDSGVNIPVHYIPLGFDSLHFCRKDKNIGSKACSLLVNGKFETRKGHDKLIPLLIKKFANKPKFIVNLAIYNIHLPPEQNQAILHNYFKGNKPFNFNILPFTNTLSELNDIYRNVDIVLDGSFAESFSIPSFTCVALGKYGVVNNFSGIKSWANSDNCVLVEPSHKESMIDNMFFKGAGDFNIGNWGVWEEEDFSLAIDKAVEKWEKNPINEAGLKLQEQFTWKNTVDKILEVI